MVGYATPFGSISFRAKNYADPPTKMWFHEQWAHSFHPFSITKAAREEIVRAVVSAIHEIC